jgi:hypothetical protein
MSSPNQITINIPILKAKQVDGHSLKLVNASVLDTEFILAVRTDAKKSKYLSRVEPDFEKQYNWLQQYNSDSSQAYFVIYDRNSNRIGTVRIYSPIGDSFCWGSWILVDGVPVTAAMESALIIYRYALYLGFRKAHFDVRKANCSVWEFHEMCGATRVSETETDIFYDMPNGAIQEMLNLYARYLPNGITITPVDPNSTNGTFVAPNGTCSRS